MITPAELDLANERLAPHILRTPLTHDAARNLYLKWENRQKTGSFKARGALNKILSLTDEERARGIVAASAGNHGQGAALAGQLTGARVACFVSDHAVPVKVNAIRALGAEIVTVAGGYPEAETAGLTFAREQNKIWVSPYNDEQVIAGQGTVGVEIIGQLTSYFNSPEASSLRGGRSSRRNHPRADEEIASQKPLAMTEILVPVSGGGLIAGIGLALSRLSPRPRLIGVQPETAPFMHGLFYNNSQDGIPDLPSLADGLTGAVEAGAITIEMVKKFVDEIVLVSEDEIAHAVAFAYREYGEVIEPSGAATLAVALRDVERNAISLNAPRVAVVSGGNIQPEVHARIVARYAEEARA
jgi:threonine dehydratase